MCGNSWSWETSGLEEKVMFPRTWENLVQPFSSTTSALSLVSFSLAPSSTLARP
jgi:hypothetical protein